MTRPERHAPAGPRRKTLCAAVAIMHKPLPLLCWLCLVAAPEERENLLLSDSVTHRLAKALHYRLPLPFGKLLSCYAIPSSRE